MARRSVELKPLNHKEYFKYKASDVSGIYQKLLALPSIKNYIENKAGDQLVEGLNELRFGAPLLKKPSESLEHREILLQTISAINQSEDAPIKDKKKISLKDFFQEFDIPNGEELYHNAGKEEVNSSAFRKAFVVDAFKKFKGNPGPDFNVIPIEGASGVGKTTSARTYVNKTFCENNQGPLKEFLLPFIDGGIPRDNCNVKKMLIEAAERKGYIIKDLHKQTKKFLDSNMKKDLSDIVFNMSESERNEANIEGVVVVETFSEESKVKKLTKNLDKLRKQNTRFTIHNVMVGGEDPAENFLNVKNMGDYRAFPSPAELEERQEAPLQRTASDIKCKEYKNYDKRGYVSGVLGSWNAFAILKEYGDKHGIPVNLTVIDNTVKLYDKDGNDFNPSSQEQPIIALKLQADAAKEIMEQPDFKFEEALKEVKNAPKFQLPISKINLDLDSINPAFHGLVDWLVLKTKDFGVVSKALGTIATQKAKSRIPSDDWPEKNVPFIVRALKAGSKVDYDNIVSLKTAQKDLQDIIKDMNGKKGSVEGRRETKPKLIEVLKKVNERITELEIKELGKTVDVVVISDNGGFEHKSFKSDIAQVYSKRDYNLKIDPVKGFDSPVVYFDLKKEANEKPQAIYDMIENALANWKPDQQFFISATSLPQAKSMLYALEHCLEKFKKHDEKYAKFKIQDIIIKSKLKAVRDLNITELLKDTSSLTKIQKIWVSKDKKHYQELLKIQDQPEYKKLIQEAKNYFSVLTEIEDKPPSSPEEQKKFIEDFKERKAVWNLMQNNPECVKALDSVDAMAKIFPQNAGQ